MPRYNRFRELLRMPRVASFEEMTASGVALWSRRSESCTAIRIEWI